MSADYEVWQAVHADCPPEGCGRCVVIELDWTDEEIRQVKALAALVGETYEAFVHKAVVAGMRAA